MREKLKFCRFEPSTRGMNFNGTLTGKYDKPDGKTHTDVDVVIPTLNEGASIGEVIQDIKRLNFTLPVHVSIVVVDGGSTDNTLEVCKKENINLIIQQGRGKGRGMREAVDVLNADIVVFMDGDGTYSPAELELLLRPLLDGTADMVVGSRTIGPMDKRSVTRLNMVGNKLFNKSINFALGSSVSDSLSGYRAIYRKAFDNFILFSHEFEIEVEITVEALENGLRIVEVPVSYKAREELAKTKLHPLRDGVKIGRALLFILMNVNPLKFFGLIALGFLSVGLYPAALVLYEKAVLGDIIHIPSVIFASLLFVMSAISLVLGLISELIVRSRRRCEHLIKTAIKYK
jgi:dolichol-phosphate hexosyltransferase